MNLARFSGNYLSSRLAQLTSRGEKPAAGETPQDSHASTAAAGQARYPGSSWRAAPGLEQVFIVGAGRSGTSVMAVGVRRLLNLPGFGEGHFYPLAYALGRATQEFYGSRQMHAVNENHMLHHVDHDRFQKRLLDLIADTFHETHREGAGFIDKTPGPTAIAALPDLQRVFPEMRVIFMKRRGIEVVRSALVKFPWSDFETHCQIWRDCMINWSKFRGDLTCPVLEIDQYDLESDPEGVARTVAHFFEIDEDMAVQDLAGFFRGPRPQSTEELAERSRDLAGQGWTQEQVATFRKVCGAIMADFGYCETEAYYLDPSRRRFEQAGS